MEAEDAAARRLEELGYTVFYRNLRFRYSNRDVCEFDIILRDCIVEVKSGKYVYSSSGGFDNVVLGGRLPKGFTFYIYCMAKTDAEIIDLNAELANPTAQYINRLEDIALKHPPDNRECIIDSQSTLAYFIRCKLSTILKFNKLYMTQNTYDKAYYQYNYTRDSFSLEEMMMWSGKLRLLMESGRIIICEEYPKTAIPLKKMPLEVMRQKGVMKARRRDPIAIPIFHNLTMMPRVADEEDIYINCWSMTENKELKESSQNNS